MSNALEQLSFLIGKWISEGHVCATDTEPQLKIFGIDEYEWVLNRCFILHRVNVWIGDEKIEALELIGEHHKNDDTFMLRSFDNSGQAVFMKASQKDNVLYITGDGMRSVLDASTSTATMTAHWEQLAAEKEWRPWMEMTFTRSK